MSRSVLLVLMLVTLATGTTACSSRTGGTAVPGGGQPGTGSTSGPETPGGSNSKRLADTDPCSLLTADGQAQLGLRNGEERKVGSARTCRWRKPGPDGVNYIYDVVIEDKAGIKDLPTENNPKPISDVGDHKAVQVTNPNNPGACSVIMDVTDSSRVGAQIVAGRDTQKGCDLALQMAGLIEPELPEV